MSSNTAVPTAPFQLGMMNFVAVAVFVILLVVSVIVGARGR